MPLTEQSVTITHPGDNAFKVGGFLVMPETVPAPGVLVLHEAFGLNDNMRDIARRFAQSGYVALAADLFADGNRAVCIFRAFYGLLLAPLSNGTVVRVRGAFDYLGQVRGVDGSRLGAIGFCMGGSYALQLACLENKVRAISIVSAQNPKPLDAVARACPIVGSYPEHDLTTKAGRALDTVLDEYKISHDIKVYAEARHSMFDDRADGYNPEIAEDAWNRTLSFFAQHLTL